MPPRQTAKPPAKPKLNVRTAILGLEPGGKPTFLTGQTLEKQPKEAVVAPEADRSATVAKSDPHAIVETAVDGILNDFGLSPESLRGLSGITAEDKQQRYFEIMNARTPQERDAVFTKAKHLVGPDLTQALDDAFNQRVSQLIHPEVSGLPALPRAIQPPQTEAPEPGMIEDDRIITKHGSRYLPVSLAAQHANVPRTTLVDWIKAKAKFQGRALQTYHSPTMRKLYLSEESVQRVTSRFVKWPSNEPAGPVMLEETRDKSGYIGIAKAARSIGVDHHTMWLWTAHGTAPTDKPLDIIKCTASDQFYIREKDISQLKKLVPPSGLRRGPRPRQAAPK